ncbi:NADH dehydrogenase ubiquinone complex I, assembly factor 6 [Hondaea fermentalgiana]|uniref:NADH dehydrogenase ubiquinone complex I, assembly factor 6 n=1 Tax=Hondaea fermentalgiana TaxID=2315210 RepID=A0A2R5GA49_9STRA|nr:NADH dehydrogenase ubiquinone complex I, assembly factor 6 [Hondaea fermentalgiana]|eukprot:GBG27896.1 NADH dehydrogenase ubiquinone complex I, assembly factor 6 [Hondaea fermentalgiana]
MMAGVGMGQQDKLNAGQGPQSIEEDEELVRAYQALTETVYDVAATAHGHLEHAREMREAIPPAALPAFQVTVPASIFLERLQSTAEFDIFNANLRNDPFSPLRVQYHIFKNSFLKTF